MCKKKCCKRSRGKKKSVAVNKILTETEFDPVSKSHAETVCQTQPQTPKVFTLIIKRMHIGVYLWSACGLLKEFEPDFALPLHI